MVWDEETIRSLKEFWTQGHSTAEIGRRLGISKNAIVGKAHRLALDARPSPIRRSADKPVIEHQVVFAKVAGQTLPPLASENPLPCGSAVPVSNVQPLRPASVIRELLPEDQSPAVQAPTLPQATSLAQAVSLAQAPRTEPRPVVRAAPVQPRRQAPPCCWPIGEPGTKTFRFCDDSSLHGKPYCDEHAKLAYVKIRDRKDDAA